MMTNDFSGKRVTVMGLGLHGGGTSVALWLEKHGARVTVTDLKTKKELVGSLRNFSPYSPPKADAPPAQKNIIFVFGKHRKEDFIDTDMVVRNPAVPRESPFLRIAEKHGVPIESEATLFFKYCKSKNIIGVTGTRGKSTTSAMIATILKARTSPQPSPRRRGGKDNPLLAGEGEGEVMIHDLRSTIHVWLAGNIRTTPMFSIVDRIKTDDWVVLELSSWHLEDMDRHKISPHVAVVTNLMPDHLNRYAGMRAYARAKEGIVRNQTTRDIAVLNKENPWTRAMAKKTKAKVYWFPNSRDRISVNNPTHPPLAKGRRGGVFGEHNRMNASAAGAVAQAIGVSKKTIISALKKFRGLPDRLELVRTVHGVQYYNDTTATTPEATIAALVALSCNVKRVTCNIILIAGGSDKNLDYKPLMPWIKKICKAVVFLPGTATKKIKKEFHVSRFTFHVREAATMPSAVRKATTFAAHGDIVLLSPAAASFGLFTHEFDRGDQFRRAVKTLNPKR